MNRERMGDAPAPSELSATPPLQAALEYAAWGWPVVPLHEVTDGRCTCGKADCRQQGKHPRGIKQWQKAGSTEPAVIRRWWTKWPTANVGVLTGSVSGLVMIGPDGEQGKADLAALEATHGALPPTPTQRSGSGGRHLVFRLPAGVTVPNRVRHHGLEIDVRGEGGQFVAAPSRNANGAYEWLCDPRETPVAEAPAWLVAWCNREPWKPATPAAPVAPRSRDAFRVGADVEARAIAYLKKIPPAVSGQGGHDQTFAAARVVVYGFDLGPEVGFRILSEHYNPRCEPPWSEKELRHKCEDAAAKPCDRPRGWLLGDRDRQHRTPGGPPNGTATVNTTTEHGAGVPQVPAGPNTAGWDPPTPFGRDTPPPEFPIEVLPEWLAAFVVALATATQTPVCAVAMLCLAAVAGGFGGKVRYLVRKGWAQPTNLFVVVVMKPGERKSAIFGAVLAPVNAAEKRAAEAAAPRIAAAKADRGVLEARIKHLQGRAAKAKSDSEREDLTRQARELAGQLAQFVVPPEPVFVVDDETLESLGKTLIEQGGRLFQAAAEGTAFEIAGGRYADDENFDVYLKAHEGDYLRVGRVGRGRQSHDAPALTCALAVQPDVLWSLGRSAKARGRGFLARWLYDVPAPRVGSRAVRPKPVPTAIRARYEDVMSDIWATDRPEGGPREVPFTTKGDDDLAAFEARLEPRLGPDGDLCGLADWGTKLAGEVARIAGNLHLAGAAGAGRLSDPGPVPGQVVQAAIRLADDFLIPHAVRAFGVMHADPVEALAQRAVRWLVRRPDLARVTRNELYHGLKGGQSELKADDLGPVMDLLVGHNFLRPVAPVPAAGRPPERFDVNPLWDRSAARTSSPESLETGEPESVTPETRRGRSSPESPQSRWANGSAHGVSGDSGDEVRAAGHIDRGGEL